MPVLPDWWTIKVNDIGQQSFLGGRKNLIDSSTCIDWIYLSKCVVQVNSWGGACDEIGDSVFECLFVVVCSSTGFGSVEDSRDQGFLGASVI